MTVGSLLVHLLITTVYGHQFVMVYGIPKAAKVFCIIFNEGWTWPRSIRVGDGHCIDDSGFKQALKFYQRSH